VSANQEENELDRPWFAADTSEGPRKGTLYMTFETTPFGPIPPEVYVKRSTDQGATWSETVRVDDGVYTTQFNPRARPASGPGGDLYVVYDRAPITVTPFLPQTSPVQLVVARSTDGARSFTRSVVDSDVHRIVSPDEAIPGYVEMIAAITVDPVNPGRVAVAWPEADGDANSRIILRYTTDSGRHWSPRIDVADDPASTDNQHDHVTLAWLADGPLFVGWRDRRSGGGSFDGRYQQWVRALGLDASGRLTPGRTVEMTDAPEPPATSGRGVAEPDEFQGLVATRLGVGLTWSRYMGPYDDLMFRNVPLSAFGASACLDRTRALVALPRPSRGRLVRVRLYVNGKLARTGRGRNLRHVALRGLPQGPFSLRAVGRTSRGRRVHGTRTFRGCPTGTPPAAAASRASLRTA
jgi:hypothetical protein